MSAVTCVSEVLYWQWGLSLFLYIAITSTYILFPSLRAAHTFISSRNASSSGIRKDPSISMLYTASTYQWQEWICDLWTICSKTLAPTQQSGSHQLKLIWDYQNYLIMSIDPLGLYIIPFQIPSLILTGFLKPFCLTSRTYTQSSAKSPILNIYSQPPLYFLALVELQLAIPCSLLR